MPLPKPHFPAAIDATMLRSARACETKFFREFCLNLRLGKSEHLIFGAAYAIGLETLRKEFYIEEASIDDALGAAIIAATEYYKDFEPPESSVKTWLNLVLALEQYVIDFNPATTPFKPYKINGTPAVEFSFSFELPVEHPETGDPILYCGRPDSIEQLSSGGVWVADDKTTKQMGDRWASSWSLRSQFFGYAFGARLHEIPVVGVLVRGMCLYKRNLPKTNSVLVYTESHVLDRWYQQTCRDVQHLVDCWNEGYWGLNYDEACTMYFGCEFQDACGSKDPDIWLADFNVSKWNPLERAL